MYRLSLFSYAEKERLNFSKLPTANGEEILWSNKLFKMWKKEFHRKYRERYDKSFKVDFPTSSQRAQIYEAIFGIEKSYIIGKYGSSEMICEESKKSINTILETMNEWK